MTQRLLWICCTVAVTGGWGGDALAAKSTTAHQTTHPQARAVSVSPHRQHDPATPTPVTGLAHRPDLKLSPAAAIAKPKPRSTSADNGGAIAQRTSHQSSDSGEAKSLSPRLDLDLPRAQDAAAPGTTQSDSANPDNEAASSQASSDNRQPLPDTDADPQPEPSDLFNRNNGLRGFMAQNWINQRLGVQGGLAIREQRLRRESSNIQDNFAVGMGVLLSF